MPTTTKHIRSVLFTEAKTAKALKHGQQLTPAKIFSGNSCGPALILWEKPEGGQQEAAAPDY
jgi:hypothetical protein